MKNFLAQNSETNKFTFFFFFILKNSFISISFGLTLMSFWWSRSATTTEKSGKKILTHAVSEKNDETSHLNRFKTADTATATEKKLFSEKSILYRHLLRVDLAVERCDTEIITIE